MAGDVAGRATVETVGGDVGDGAGQPAEPTDKTDLSQPRPAAPATARIDLAEIRERAKITGPRQLPICQRDRAVLFAEVERLREVLSWTLTSSNVAAIHLAVEAAIADGPDRLQQPEGRASGGRRVTLTLDIEGEGVTTFLWQDARVTQSSESFGGGLHFDLRVSGAVDPVSDDVFVATWERHRAVGA